MSSRLQEARRERIRLDQDALAHTKDCMRDLRRAKDEAQQTLAALAMELEQLERRQASLESSLGEARAAYQRTLWSGALSLDVMSCIFDELCNGDDALWTTFGCGSYNVQRARSPFALAAVCSRWRKLALSTSTLWTYIGGRHECVSGADVKHVRLLLLRSKSAPLDVLLRWSHCKATTYLEHMQAILSAIDSARIRRFELWLPAEVPREPTMDIFKAPTPLLTHLCIIGSSSNNWQSSPRDTFFPLIDKMQYIGLHHTGMCISQQHPPLDKLTSLTMWSGWTYDQFRTILFKGASTLQQLQIHSASQWSLPPRFVVMPVSLLALTSLTIDADVPPTALQSLVMPCLRSMTLGCAIAKPSIVPFLERIAEQISSLTISSYGTRTAGAACLPVLQTLQHVETLSFDARTRNDTYSVADDFFVYLANTTPCIWPKLKRVELPRNGTVKPANGDGIVQLLRARSSSADMTTDYDPCAIERITLKYNGAPAWLSATVKSLTEHQ